MQLDPVALEWAIAAYNTDVFTSDKAHVEHIVSAYLQAVQPAPVVTTITAATIEKACTDPIEIWPTGWRETYPALASPNVGTVKVRLLAALTATASAEPVVPDGWQLVPKEPTDDMLKALLNQSDWSVARAFGMYSGARAFWKAMLAAAPLPAQGGKADD